MRFIPHRLAAAAASHAMIDVVLAAYVNARCGVAKRRPPEWKKLPERSVVRGEVGAITGLLRLADALPADPRGSIPRARLTMRKCKCNDKHEASPRSYTFVWELEAAWRLSVDRNDPREVIVWCWCVVAIFFLLRPVYARALTPTELKRSECKRMFLLRWQRDDKGRPAGRPTNAPTLRVALPCGLPAKHPRLTAAAHPLLTTALAILQQAKPPGDPTAPLFCRVEAARQTGGRYLSTPSADLGRHQAEAKPAPPTGGQPRSSPKKSSRATCASSSAA